jgi:hypothetical protein
LSTTSYCRNSASTPEFQKTGRIPVNSFEERLAMTFFLRCQETLERLKPRLDYLADGDVELLEADETKGIVKVKVLGGRLH